MSDRTDPDSLDSEPSSPRLEGESLPEIPDHRLLRRIGTGSYGEVWLAQNILGTYRAVKIVHRRNFEHDRPYQREFEGIRKYEPVSRSHESQVVILHVGQNQEQEYFYYVMELADHAVDAASTTARESAPTRGRIQMASYRPKTLKSELRRRGRLPVHECVEVGLALTRALEVLHQNGLVHRDIKPANIIFIQGRPRLADIGLVTDADTTKARAGTEGFIPPEGSGQPQADLFALGKVLYEISTGKDRLDYPELPADLDAWTERKQWLELDAIIQRACDPRLRNRYARGTEMHDDLLLLRGGRSVKQHRRNRARLIAAAATCFILLLAGSVLWWAPRVRAWVDRGKEPSTARSTAVPVTSSAEALNALRLGHFHLERRTRGSLQRAHGYYEQAVQLDPQCAAAFAGLAKTYYLSTIYASGRFTNAWQDGLTAARRALEIDPANVDGHLVLAEYHQRVEWDYASAESEFNQALRLGPNHAQAHQWYSSLLSLTGRHEEAIAMAHRAIQLEPASLVINANLGARYFAARDYPAAVEQYRKVLVMDPNFPLARKELYTVLETMGDYDAAHQELITAYRLYGRDESFIAPRVADYAEGGWLGYWKKELARVEQDPGATAFRTAWIHARLGNIDPILTWLADRFESGQTSVASIEANPSWDRIRRDPRYAALAERYRSLEVFPGEQELDER